MAIKGSVSQVALQGYIEVLEIEGYNVHLLTIFNDTFSVIKNVSIRSHPSGYNLLLKC